MSSLNWRCCAKNLGRFKKNVRILIREIYDHEVIYIGEYQPDFKEIAYDGFESRLADYDFIGYEYVTLGEL